MVKIICPDCGKEQDNSNKFCRNCGADLSKVEIVEKTVSGSDSFGETVSGSVSGSDSFGETVSGSVSGSSQNGSIKVPALTENGTNSNELIVGDNNVEGENTKKCSVCGAEVDSNTKFCPNCGNALADSNKTFPKNFCPSCGVKITSDQKFCPNCGLNLSQAISNSKKVSNNVIEKKTPILSVILSVLLPGLGQFYNGQSKKGTYFLIFAVVSWFLCIILIGLVAYALIWIWSIFDAYQSAEAINRGEILEDKLF